MNTINQSSKIFTENLMPNSKAPKKGEGFGEAMKNAIGQVNKLQTDAEVATEQVVKGELGIHEGMVALSEADISMRVLLQVRNKVMDAYKEIIRMPF
ncbi:MAG: flagellar hook-basal body complex protein FliE [Desulfobacterales bacterium]|nr:flagellar hook-basal body complex protein FliE [Desulfobacterales bacterium]